MAEQMWLKAIGMWELRKLVKVWSKLLVMGIKLSRKGGEVEVGKGGDVGKIGG